MEEANGRLWPDLPFLMNQPNAKLSDQEWLHGQSVDRDTSEKGLCFLGLKFQ